MSARFRQAYPLLRPLLLLLGAALVWWVVTQLLAGEEAQIPLRLAVALLWLGFALLVIVTALWINELMARLIVREQRQGGRLRRRIVTAFGVMAAVPTLLLSLFAAIMLSVGYERLFSEPVNRAVSTADTVTSAYIQQAEERLRADAVAVASQLNRQLSEVFEGGTELRDLLNEIAIQLEISEIVLLDGTLYPFASGGTTIRAQVDLPQISDEDAEASLLSPKILPSLDQRTRVLTRFTDVGDFYVYLARLPEPEVTAQIGIAQEAVRAFSNLEAQRRTLTLTFFVLMGLVSMLVLVTASLSGLLFAARFVGPIRDLIRVAEDVQAGNTGAGLSLPDSGGDELATMGRAFNAMMTEINQQRTALLNINQALEARQQFTQAVLSGVSAGVLGLDAEARLTLPNRRADELLGIEFDSLRGRRFEEILPEFSGLLARAVHAQTALYEEQLRFIERKRGEVLTLLLSVVVSRNPEGQIDAYVVTFDDVTSFLAAQRQAAWSDVARRVAHEIKNPLTPIQLSAERMRKRTAKVSDPADRQVFDAALETISRQVSNIGRMVGEFSRFARMPSARIASANLSEVCRMAVFLQRNADSHVRFKTRLPAEDVWLPCDAALVSQALTNLLKNASESLLSTDVAREDKPAIELTLRLETSQATITIRDNGKGYDPDKLDSLTEPYVTTRAKGTGLGLAIVKKIMDDHGGSLSLTNGAADSAWPGAQARLVFPRESSA